jgi:tRNA(Arg) A34 adenosine deaminase TadA
MVNKRVIQLGIKVALQSEEDFKVGAVLYKGGSIIRFEPNSNSYLGYRKKYFKHDRPTRHAELSTIHKVPRDILASCSILVVRVNKKGEVTCAKPCPACYRALVESGIKNIYYSDYNGDILKLDKNLDFDTYQKDYI